MLRLKAQPIHHHWHRWCHQTVLQAGAANTQTRPPQLKQYRQIAPKPTTQASSGTGSATGKTHGSQTSDSAATICGSSLPGVLLTVQLQHDRQSLSVPTPRALWATARQRRSAEMCHICEQWSVTDCCKHKTTRRLRLGSAVHVPTRVEGPSTQASLHPAHAAAAIMIQW